MGRCKLVASGCRVLAAYCAYQSIFSLFQLFASASFLMNNGYPRATAVATAAPSFVGFWIGAGLLMYLAEPLGRFAERGHNGEGPQIGGVNAASAAIPMFSLLLIAAALPSLVITLIETYLGVQATRQTLSEYLAMGASHEALRVIIYDVAATLLGLVMIWFRPGIIRLIFRSNDAAAKASEAGE
jgi:hypothetical protein